MHACIHFTRQKWFELVILWKTLKEHQMVVIAVCPMVVIAVCPTFLAFLFGCLFVCFFFKVYCFLRNSLLKECIDWLIKERKKKKRVKIPCLKEWHFMLKRVIIHLYNSEFSLFHFFKLIFHFFKLNFHFFQTEFSLFQSEFSRFQTEFSLFLSEFSLFQRELSVFQNDFHSFLVK